jgi:TetR/AcrR family transcriptional regulator, transcriptional repressor for nem operon
MGVVKSREETKKETREALVSAAGRLFVQHGLDAPSLDDICAEAGYTRGAFYVHFRDREELVAAVAEKNAARRIETILAEAGKNLELEQTIKMFVTAVESGAYPGVGAVKLHQYMAAVDRSAAVRRAQHKVIERGTAHLTAAAREAQKAGRIRKDIDPEVVADLLLALVGGVEQRIALGAPINVTRGAKALLKLLRPPP